MTENFLDKLFESISKGMQLTADVNRLVVILKITELCLAHKKKPREVIKLMKEVSKELSKEKGGELNDNNSN